MGNACAARFPYYLHCLNVESVTVTVPAKQSMQKNVF